MPRLFSQRLLSVLQLTRMALVFTAISNSVCEVLVLAQLRSERAGLPGYLETLDGLHLTVVIVISIGLYTFGMSLNDIIDRRRDQQLAAHRPLPSGRIGVTAAHAICTLCLLLALLGGAYLARFAQHGTLSLLLVLWTAFLITMYDYAGKYLVWLGLLTLGAIRFFHALVPAPTIPLIWHPLLLLNHVTILSAVCYHLEDKRPTLSKTHWWSLAGLLALMNVICLAGEWWLKNRDWDVRNLREAWRLRPELAIPGAAVVGFVVFAWVVRRRQPDPRRAGQSIMLYGLLWLIVYDACFVAAYVSPVAGGLLLLLLPAAYVSVQLMRWWAKVISLSQRPTFQRAR
jgi:hypothetical protein